MKRLFLFAAYDPHDVIAMADIHYIKALRKLGDVVFCADNNLSEEVLAQLAAYTIHAEGKRHNEYDFGSYKRCWMWANANLDMSGYDFVYLVNNSVVGPFRPLEPLLTKLEHDADVTGMCYCPKKRGSHIQSWFVGVSRKLFSTPAFDDFLRGVRAESDKSQIYSKYENGLTALLEGMGCKKSILLTASGKSVYNKVETLFDAGLPFIKKSSFVRHNGCLGRQINYVLRQTPSFIAEDAAPLLSGVEADFDRLHGKGALKALTQPSATQTIIRYCRYLANKIFRKLRE